MTTRLLIGEVVSDDLRKQIVARMKEHVATIQGVVGHSILVEEGGRIEVRLEDTGSHAGPGAATGAVAGGILGGLGGWLVIVTTGTTVSMVKPAEVTKLMLPAGAMVAGTPGESTAVAPLMPGFSCGLEKDRGYRHYWTALVRAIPGTTPSVPK